MAISIRTTPDPEQGVRDRELDLPRAAVPVHLSRLRPEPFQRLVANPFLGLFGIIVWLGVVRETLLIQRLDLFLGAVACIPIVFLLFQYHCLDCGRTARLKGWRKHECESVKTRRLAGLPRRFRGPSPGTQTVLWFFVLAVGSLFIAVLRF